MPLITAAPLIKYPSWATTQNPSQQKHIPQAYKFNVTSDCYHFMIDNKERRTNGNCCVMMTNNVDINMDIH